VRPITPEVASRLGLRSLEGVFVARLEDGSPAAESGVQRGDIIKQINRQNCAQQWPTRAPHRAA